MDIYKGLENIVKAIDEYEKIYAYLEPRRKTLGVKVIVQIADGHFKKMRIEAYDKDILFSGIEQKERSDIEDFLIYRDKTYEKDIDSSEIMNLQRVLNIVITQYDQSPENRLINLWSTIEYILTFHEGISIISKVRDIVPKVISLYVIKDLVNIFWLRLLQYKNIDNPVINEFVLECQKENDRYDLEKLISFIQTKGRQMVDTLSFNDVLNRSICEIGDIFSNKEKRLKFIENKYNQVDQDLVRIYRTRNKLIHSGRKIEDNLDYKALRLYEYNKSLIGVLIYYKNINPYSTIPEILNSIIHTYNDYKRLLNDDSSDLVKICKPDYLFLGE